MYIFGGPEKSGDDEEEIHDVWCLDLGTICSDKIFFTQFLASFTWSQCDFPSYATKGKKQKLLNNFV